MAATPVQAQGEALSVGNRNNVVGPTVNAEYNHQGAAGVAMFMPFNAEVTRQGATFVCGTSTPVAPVAALPTTASQFSVYCPQGQTKSLVIHRIQWTTIVSAGAAFVGQLLFQVTTAAVGSITGTAATAIKPISSVNASIATAFSAVTTVANGIWAPLGPSVNGGAATATIAMGADTGDLGGLIIIQPGMHLDTAVLCSAAGSATCDIFVYWSEIQC